MKRNVFLLMALFTCNFVFAQDNQMSGIIKYQYIKKIELKLEGDLAQLADKLPKESKSVKELLFNDAASLYRNQVKVQEDENNMVESNGSVVLFSVQNADEQVYCDLKNKTNIAQREFMTRQFLVESNTDTVQWKITGNQKRILDLNCLEAELVGSSKKTIAWFAPTIAVSTGPDGYTGLPGLILELDIYSGNVSITAQSIEFRAVASNELEKPKKGKKISEKEYNKIKNDKIKELKGNSTSGTFFYTTD